MPPNPPTNAHGFAMRSMSLRDMQIPKSEKIFLGPGACPGGGPRGLAPPLEIEKPKKKGHQGKF